MFKNYPLKTEKKICFIDNFFYMNDTCKIVFK